MGKPWYQDAFKYGLLIVVASTISSLISLSIQRATIAQLQNEVTQLKAQVAYYAVKVA